MLAPGDQLKDYEVVATLTEGGMATLVLARRKLPSERGSLVALKVVHEHLSDDSGMIRLFLDEARVTARVKHANVVHVEEVGIHGSAYFLVMEYVHGVSLASLLGRLAMERRRMTPRLAVYLAAQAAEALHAAHEATDGRGRPLNVVHRDVSPQNFLISHMGHVKLIDFGIATSQTGTGVLGKLSYMAPEQVTLAEVDRRTDVYSLGIVLWEMLTGRALFRSQNYDDYRDPAIRTRIAPPSRYGSEVPALLDEVVLRALAPQPDERWESAAAFRRALLQAVPDAANLDPGQLSAVIHHFASDEIARLRERLPDDILEELDHERSPYEGSGESNTAVGLTLEQLDHGLSLMPAPVPPPPPPPRRVSSNPPTLRFRSLTPEELAPPELTSDNVQRDLRKRFIWASAAVGLVCLLAGVAIGRATRPEPSTAAPSAAQVNSDVTAAPAAVRATDGTSAAETKPAAKTASPVAAPKPSVAPKPSPATPSTAATTKPAASVKSGKTTADSRAKAKVRKRRPTTTTRQRLPPPEP